MNFGTTVGETDHIWSVNMHLESLRPPGRLIGQFPVTAIDIQPGVAGGCSIAHHRVGNVVLIRSTRPPCTTSRSHTDQMERLISRPPFVTTQKPVKMTMCMGRERDSSRTGLHERVQPVQLRFIRSEEHTS